MKLRISEIFAKAIVFMASICLFISCEKDDADPDPTWNWKAETTVDENEVAATGISHWFKAEEISDEIFSRMWLKSWKENCPLDRSELRYLKVLHRNADGKPQRGEMVVNTAIADKMLAIFMQLYEAGYRIERMVLIDNFDAEDRHEAMAVVGVQHCGESECFTPRTGFADIRSRLSSECLFVHRRDAV